MVKTLILIRHAESTSRDNTKSLTADGIVQCYKISEVIRGHLIDSNATIWHSPHQNATETARFIGSRLSISHIHPNKKLISDIKHHTDLDWLKEAIQECNSEVLIIVSHLEYVWYYPEHIGFKQNTASYGEGVMIRNSVQTILTL